MVLQGLHVQVGFDPEGQEYIAPRHPSPYLRSLFSYIKALNSMDYENIMASFDEQLVHTILPQVLKKPVLGFQNYGKYLQAIIPMFENFQVRLHEVIEEDHKMTVHATAKATGASGRPYVNELVLMIHFVPFDVQEMRRYGGPQHCPEALLPKMIKVKEFVDSESTLKWFKEERQWMKEQQQQQQGRSQGPRQQQSPQMQFVQGSSRRAGPQGQQEQSRNNNNARQGPGSLTIPTLGSASTSAPQRELRWSPGYPNGSPFNSNRYSGV